MQNAMAAKIIGEILANGMSLSDTNLAESINSAAADTLDEIRAVISDGKKSEKQKVKEVNRIIKNQGIF